MSGASMVRVEDRWRALVTVGLAASLIMIDGSVVNLALPSLISDLGLRSTHAEWVNVAYYLALASLLLPAGAAGDRFGHRAVLLTGLVTLFGASLLVGLAGGAPSLLAGRTLQGVGAAMILPASLATVDAAFRGRERATAFGLWGGLIGTAVAVGPILGGALTSYGSWRWAFLINVPVTAVVLVASLRYLRPADRERAPESLRVGRTVTVALGCGALVFAVIEGERYGWWELVRPFTVGPLRWPTDAISPVPVAGAIAVACGLVLLSARSRRTAAAPQTVLVGRTRIAVVIVGVVQAGEVGLLFVLPYALQSALGYGPMEAGLLLAATAAGALSAAPLAGPLSRRYSARAQISTALVVEASAVSCLFVALGPGRGWMIAGALFVYGAGLGLATAQLTQLFLSTVPDGQVGRAAGVQSFAGMVGAALGVAVLGAILLGGLRSELDRRLTALPELSPARSVQLRDEVHQTLGGTLPGLRADPATRRAAEESGAALVDATKYAALSVSCVITLGYLLSLRLPRNSSRRREPAVPS